MFEKIKTLLGKTQKKHVNDIQKQSAVSHIKKYIITIPLDYNLMQKTNYININSAYFDNPNNQTLTNMQYLSLPINDTVCKYLTYLHNMEKNNPQVLFKTFTRTVYTIDLTPDQSIYILPPIPTFENRNIGSTTIAKHDWPLYVTKELQKDILQYMKLYPRAR